MKFINLDSIISLSRSSGFVRSQKSEQIFSVVKVNRVSWFPWLRTKHSITSHYYDGDGIIQFNNFILDGYYVKDLKHYKNNCSVISTYEKTIIVDKSPKKIISLFFGKQAVSQFRCCRY